MEAQFCYMYFIDMAIENEQRRDKTCPSQFTTIKPWKLKLLFFEILANSK